MVRSKSLSLGIPSNPSPISSNVTSPTDPGSHPSSPGSTTASRAHEHSLPQSRLIHTELQIPASHVPADPPLSPEFTSLPPFPASPTETPKGGQESSKGFFANLKASKSSNKVNNVPEPTIQLVSEENSRRDIGTPDDSVYSKKSQGSNPDLSLATHDSESTLAPDEGKAFLTADELRRIGQRDQDQHISRRPVGSPTRSDDAIRKGKMEAPQLQTKKPKPRFSNLINRTRSVRVDAMQSPGDKANINPQNSGLSGAPRSKTVTPIITTYPPESQVHPEGADERVSRMNTPITPNTPMSASLPSERSAHSEKNLGPGPSLAPGSRTRSADRSLASEPQRLENKHLHSGLGSSSSATFREGPSSSSHLLSNIKNTSSRAAGGLNKAGKGIFAKMGRSGSSTSATQAEDQRYVCRIINLPLREQTRKTRIAARLENSKDKTEFWMPALPWRCIDYLNFRGCEEEGLYRVPGSDREIRLWQKRFDQGMSQGDINLFEEDNLYDINIIGSLFKSWLRELPTEVFPKATQTKIYQDNPNAIDVPQMLKDELSMLPPWNYYLLFAITCHLSLLTACSDKNKMTYGNLVICFQPCLKIDNFCFQFLVQQWRECWQGCWTEKDCLEVEYHIIDGREGDVPGSSGDSSGGSTAVGGEERSVASSASNQPMNTGRAQPKLQQKPQSKPQQGRPPPLKLSTTHDDEHLSTANGNGPLSSGHAGAESQLPELAPVQPLSPIGF